MQHSVEELQQLLKSVRKPLVELDVFNPHKKKKNSVSGLGDSESGCGPQNSFLGHDSLIYGRSQWISLEPEKKADFCGEISAFPESSEPSNKFIFSISLRGLRI